jgi:hypothetical protein
MWDSTDEAPELNIHALSDNVDEVAIPSPNQLVPH